MIALGTMQGELKRGIEGVNHRLDTLNGSVGKHEQRLNGQDIMNAQTTMSQQQLVEKIGGLEITNKEKDKNGKAWVDRVIWSIIIPGVSFIIILVLTKLGILNIQ